MERFPPRGKIKRCLLCCFFVGMYCGLICRALQVHCAASRQRPTSCRSVAALFSAQLRAPKVSVSFIAWLDRIIVGSPMQASAMQSQ